MSTNYYFEVILDKEVLCNNLELNDFLLRQIDTRIHIGKRSVGWVPLFHKTDFFDSVQGIRKFYNENESYLNILDEYGWEISFEELEEELLLWYGGLAAYEEPKKRVSLEGFKIVLDEEGNEFLEEDFI